MTTPMTLDSIRHAPKALLHDHLDGGLRPATVLELAEVNGYDELPLPASTSGDGSAPPRTGSRCAWNRSRTRSVDADTGGPAGWPTNASKTWRPTTSYAVSGSRPNCISTAGCRLTRSPTPCWPASPTAAGRQRQRPGITVRCLVTAMRHAARSRDRRAGHPVPGKVLSVSTSPAPRPDTTTRRLDAFEPCEATRPTPRWRASAAVHP